MNVIVAVLPSLDAVMTTDPADTPRTTPLVETVAIDVFDDVQPMVRPVRTLPDASFSVMSICIVPPTAMVVELADNVILVTGCGAGASTVSVAAPV